MSEETVVVCRAHNAFGRAGWRQRITDPSLFAEFEKLEQRLLAETKTPLRDARAAVNYLVHFCRLCRNPGQWPPEDTPLHPSKLTGTQPDAQLAEKAWQVMVTRAHWRPAYLREVRTNLSRVLLLLAEPLAHIVNPRLYKGACGLAEFQARRSQESQFLLHECLPWRVRTLAPGCVEYRLLCRIGDRMAECLQSVSRNHLRSILVLFDHILHDAPALWPPDNLDGVDARWDFLRDLSAAAWLRRYECVLQPRQRLGVDLWKRHIRYISHFHSHASSYMLPCACRRLHVCVASGHTAVHSHSAGHAVQQSKGGKRQALHHLVADG